MRTFSLLALALVLPATAAAQDPNDDKVLFIEWGGNYIADGSRAYVELQRLTSNTVYANLQANPGSAAAAIQAANQAGEPFDQIWSYDLSAATDNRPADIQAVADWYTDQSGGHVIADGRFLGSFRPGRSVVEGRQVATNYYTNLRGVGGGIVLATDHNVYANGGTNPVAALMGMGGFTGNFSGPLPFDTTSVLFNNPLTVTGLSNDTSTGQAPVGVLPNGLVLTPIAYHSGDTTKPGISSTFGSSFNLNVSVNTPEDNYLLCPPDDGVTASASVQGAVGDVAYTWFSDLDGQLGVGQSFELTTDQLQPGNHQIRVVAADRFIADGESITVQVGGDLCDDDGDDVLNGVDQCPGFDDALDEDEDGVPNDCDPCFGALNLLDADADGVCDDQDECRGDDATGDTDSDGVCDDLDQCTGDDAQPDTDDDGICEDIDACTGDDETGDADTDGVCDDLDQCTGDDAQPDTDDDGICEDLDACTGDDETGDADTDGICDDIDLCTGDDGVGDTDDDGVCDDQDACLGDDAQPDTDNDGICEDIDLCTGDDATLDGDDDGFCGDLDCRDDDPDAYPGADELCNGLDDDCNSVVPADEADADGDSYRICDDDCDDTLATVYDGAPELCDELDNDCDDAVDEDFQDTNEDGVLDCLEEDLDQDGMAPFEGDCNDTDATVYDGAPELCDGIDNDCDGVVPEVERDADSDGFAECEGDCDDADPLTSPTAVEACDGVDNDCDGELRDDEVDNDLDGVLACDDGCDDDPAITEGSCTDPLLDDEPDYIAGGCDCSSSPSAPLFSLLPLLLGGLLVRRRRGSPATR